MAKRKNRLGPIDHGRHQLLNLKTLEPVSTPEELRPLSDTLIDLALAALDEVYRLEAGDTCEARRLERIYHLANTLPNMIVFQRRQPGGTTDS